MRILLTIACRARSSSILGSSLMRASPYAFGAATMKSLNRSSRCEILRVRSSALAW
jgi:hypothetical protein